mgnify:CR=1 FL=1
MNKSFVVILIFGVLSLSAFSLQIKVHHHVASNASANASLAKEVANILANMSAINSAPVSVLSEPKNEPHPVLVGTKRFEKEHKRILKAIADAKEDSASAKNGSSASKEDKSIAKFWKKNGADLTEDNKSWFKRMVGRREDNLNKNPEGSPDEQEDEAKAIHCFVEKTDKQEDNRLSAPKGSADYKEDLATNMANAQHAKQKKEDFHSENNFVKKVLNPPAPKYVFNPAYSSLPVIGSIVNANANSQANVNANAHVQNHAVSHAHAHGGVNAQTN